MLSIACRLYNVGSQHSLSDSYLEVAPTTAWHAGVSATSRSRSLFASYVLAGSEQGVTATCSPRWVDEIDAWGVSSSRPVFVVV